MEKKTRLLFGLGPIKKIGTNKGKACSETLTVAR